MMINVYLPLPLKLELIVVVLLSDVAHPLVCADYLMWWNVRKCRRRYSHRRRPVNLISLFDSGKVNPGPTQNKEVSQMTP